ncbi:FAD-dependent monooxygenase, partial [Acinetobacter baumannii]|nr:FAD-dependent monooxygenase [Acinetobacter baumannii]
LALLQYRIERTLSEWVGEHGVPIYRGREVTGFTSSDDAVRVELSDGFTLRAQYLVGCDGGRSLTRKIAGIVAVGYNPYAPMCDESMVKWAIEFAHHDVTLLAGKFANGETGKADNEAERIEQFKRAIRRFFEKDHDRNSWVQCKIAGWIPKGWFTRDLTKMAAFKTVRNGS